MQWKNCNEWVPTDGFILEDAAMLVATSNASKLVTAGPGAGKTELLAQRASYLLETNTCINPKKILAISFKKDAALNLKDRVEKRCGNELVFRFNSMTFDAFAKSLLDRFMNGLPVKIKPNKNYDIGLNNENNGKSILSFQAISKLATEIIRTNPSIKKSLQLTYSHIFLDEFQDTTSIQYELVKACFLDSKAVITAVGDSKQRIMLWAGARRTVFEDYLSDFKATKEILLMNHRSAPRLVEIQKAMYANLNEKEANIKPSPKWDSQMGEAFLRFFNDENTETEVICNEIIELIESGTKPNDICILVKQTVDTYSESIIKRLEDSSIRARNETVYQDLLKEEIVKILTFIFILTTSKQNPNEWRYINNFFCEIESLDENSKTEEFMRVENEVNILLKTFANNIHNISDPKIFNQNINIILERLSYDRLAAIFPEYKNKAYYSKKILEFKKLLWKEYLLVNDWKVAIENFIGENSIPIMTIHKSKGLEYKSVFFIGLEDSAFWNFANQPDEDKCAFFVALSRAKNRVDFTFCRARRTRFNNIQSNEGINELYDMLSKTGLVKVENH
ncbi:UvrD-like helicase family protein [Ruminiclostridium sufflavum DSM 19573]|uniref:DNA 3'-5' helicase n=1 Tax=Ruminiclostridium sufflavum DSM 19573 TaxID=1121337 RepID=A0A318XG55_9FIRM|nr:ATP-dependent helicase [Ruminiclostridium sufflavum]PYG84922.1 UvrD-like helicase family protein [Ruminiclostridium sufflavum DSM 19573]